MRDWEHILAHAKREAGTWPWERVPPEASGMPDAKGYQVRNHQGWTVVVFQFSIEDQGFPPGSVGYDGAVRFESTIVHCTREVAKELWLVAHIKAGS